MKVKFANFIHIMLNVLGRLVLSIGIGLILMYTVYLLPVDIIDKNVSNSTTVFEKEGTYPKMFSWCTSQLDNFTDSIMLIEASAEVDDYMQSAMNNNYYLIDGQSPDVSLIKNYTSNYNDKEIIKYGRYWHGYLVILKPLLLIFNYSQIRIINGICQLLLSLFLVYSMYKKGLKEYILAYILSLLIINPFVISNSLQFSSCFYIFTLGCIFITCIKDVKESHNKVLYLFLFLGILTAFFDFLTYPIITLGMPLVFYFIKDKNDNIKHIITTGFKFVLLWGIGFVGMWSSKWIVGSIITKSNILLDALNIFSTRSSHVDTITNSSISVISAILKNSMYSLFTPITILICIYALYLIIETFKKYNYKIFLREKNILIPYFIICCIPFAWYVCTVNHSYIHAFFTNKCLMISVFSFFSYLITILKNKQIEY